MSDWCSVDGCDDYSTDDSDLCEEHEVMAIEDVWPDFHDESADWADVYADAQFEYDTALEYAGQEPF